jgi:tetratricopeptide (TPR) repeat protein
MRQSSKSQPVWCRSFTTTQTPTDKLRNAINKARHDHPFLLPTLVIACFASLSWLALLVYDEYTREKPNLGAYSPAVEQHLRNAIWYTEIKIEPGIAADSFTRAIAQVEREGMDPFSPEFTGIHIRFAAALEKFGQAKGAIEVLNRLVDDLVERIEDIDRGRFIPRKAKMTQPKEGEAQTPSPNSNAFPSLDATETERGRLLKQVIECKVKISNLYDSDHIQDNASARRVIDEAMKLLIEAMRDPESLQFDENRAGISSNEAAAMLSQVGTSYITWGSHDTALEIFKLALVAVRKANKGRPSCHESLTISNMVTAATMMLDSPNPHIDGKPATEASMRQARQTIVGWAEQSRICTEAVDPKDWDQLCAMAAITAYTGMANTLMELGDLKKARHMWEQILGKGPARTEYKELVPVAELALKEIEKRENRS